MGNLIIKNKAILAAAVLLISGIAGSLNNLSDSFGPVSNAYAASKDDAGDGKCGDGKCGGGKPESGKNESAQADSSKAKSGAQGEDGSGHGK